MDYDEYLYLLKIFKFKEVWFKVVFDDDIDGDLDVKVRGIF